MRISPIAGELPDLSALAAAAAQEGHTILARLTAEWRSGAQRFDGVGEALLAATADGRIVAIGGITREPSDPALLRMRRFYVHPDFRGRGYGAALARQLIGAPASRGRPVTVHAGIASAAPFWESLGFEPVTGRPYSHVLAAPFSPSAAAP